jgi:ribosomal protein S18 acetylase RimI-like enzyme
VELTTVPANLRAHRLYESRGFREIGEVDNIAGDGRVVRELRMLLPLRDGARPPERTFAPPA